MISVVLPVYNNASQLRELITELKTVLLEIATPYEIILVDDASTDHSLEICKQLHKEFNTVKVIALPQNNGQHKAIYKGLQKAKGEWIVIIDADGQDDPHTLKALYESSQNGYDAVLVERKSRKSALLDKITNRLFYFLWQLLGQKRANPKTSNFGIYAKSLIEAILSAKFPPYSMQLIALKLNAPITFIKGEHRASPHSSYSFKKRWQLARSAYFLYAYKSLKRFLLLGVVFILLANSILVRYLLKGHANLKYPFLDAVLISLFMLIGAMFLFLFFSVYNIKKDNLKID